MYAAGQNDLLNSSPVILMSFEPARDNQTVASVLCQKFDESWDQVFKSFVRRNISKEKQGLVAGTDSQLMSRLQSRQCSVRDRVVNAERNNTHLPFLNAKPGEKLPLHRFR